MKKMYLALVAGAAFTTDYLYGSEKKPATNIMQFHFPAILSSSCQQQFQDAVKAKELTIINDFLATARSTPAGYGSLCTRGFVLSNTDDVTQSTLAHHYCSQVLYNSSISMTAQYNEVEGGIHYPQNSLYSNAYAFWIIAIKTILKQINPSFNQKEYEMLSCPLHLGNSLPGSRDASGATWVDHVIKNMEQSLNSTTNFIIANGHTHLQKERCKDAIKMYLAKYYGDSSLHKKIVCKDIITPTDMQDTTFRSASLGIHFHTPLHNACMMGHTQALALLKNSNNTDTLNAQGHTPIQTAIICNRDDSLYHLFFSGYYGIEQMKALAPFAKLWNKKHAGKFLHWLYTHDKLLSKAFIKDIAYMIMQYHYTPANFTK